jgi:hypothetical protein
MKILISFLFVLALAAGSTVVSYAQMPMTPAEGGQGHGGGRHPEIHHAMHALENAKSDLEHSAHDYQGHRVKALELVNEAISELQQALASAKD